MSVVCCKQLPLCFFYYVSVMYVSEFQQWQRITSDQKEIKRCAGMDDKKEVEEEEELELL